MQGFMKFKNSDNKRVLKSRVQYAEPKDCAVSLEDWLRQTRDENSKVRQRAVGNACPCHLKRNVPELWDRLIEMVTDEDVKVRSSVLHTLGDGSPRVREMEIVAAIERMWNDPDERLRRHVRKLLASYRRTGKLNIL